MKNSDKIRNMSDEQLAYMINIGFPSCGDVCEDNKIGCAMGCKYRAGELKILEWLKSEED